MYWLYVAQRNEPWVKRVHAHARSSKASWRTRQLFFMLNAAYLDRLPRYSWAARAGYTVGAVQLVMCPARVRGSVSIEQLSGRATSKRPVNIFTVALTGQGGHILSLLAGVVEFHSHASGQRTICNMRCNLFDWTTTFGRAEVRKSEIRFLFRFACH